MTAEPPRQGGLLRRYSAVLEIPHVRPPVVAALLARMPVGMFPLAIVLFVRDEAGGYEIAGVVAAVVALTAAAMAPAQGRLIDRFGIPQVVIPLALGQPAALVALIVVTAESANVAAMIACALLVGAFAPPMFAAIQSLLASLARPRGLLESTFAFEAVLQEIVFFVGPLGVAALVATWSPTAALAACGALTLGGGVSFAFTRAARQWRPDERVERTGLAGALASAGIRTFAIVGAISGFVFGSLEIAMPAFAGEHGSASAGGVLLAGVALGSMIGGLWYAGRGRTFELRHQYILFLALLTVALAPLVIANSIAAMLGLSLLAGFFIAPSFATELALVGDFAPGGRLTEAFTWLSMSVVAGIAAGNALAGALVEGPGVRSAFVALWAAAACAAAVAFARRGTLDPAR